MSELQRFNRLGEVLSEKDRTGKWLATQLGKREETISAYVTQRIQPPLNVLFEIADHLEVDVRELLVPNKKSPHKNFKF